MSEDISKQFPYRTLGFQLRSLREKKQESITDVSGAVEIDTNLLVSIENGSKLPSEDILLLLISHFGLKNEEAMKLWKLAGYDSLIDNNPSTDNHESQTPPNLMLVLPLDVRVVYTDTVQITANNYGIVLNFLQNSAQKTSQSMTVARVGMSREYAQTVITLLQEVLAKKNGSNEMPSSKSNDTFDEKKVDSD